MDKNQVNDEIYLRRKQKIVLPISENQEGQLLPISYILQLNGNLNRLHYTLLPELAFALEKLSKQQFANIAEKIIITIQKMLGDWVKYRPMYPNFPQQLQDISDDNLKFNQAVHYLGDWFGVRILPKYQKDPRPPLEKQSKSLSQIYLGTVDDFLDIFDNLLKNKISWSEQDKQDLTWFLQYIHVYYQVDKWVETVFTNKKYLQNKENLAFVISTLLKFQYIDYKILFNYCPTATDLLRVAVAWSDGDVSLAMPCKFGYFPRAFRRAWVQRLDEIDSERGIATDMKRYPEYYKRLGEHLHPSEYAKKYPQAHQGFTVIREKLKVETFHQQIETLLLEPTKIDDLLTLLSTRAGELARKLDKLLRMANDNDKQKVIKTFEKVVDNVPTRILLQMFAHFNQRTYQQLPKYRVFFPKGQVNKLFAKRQNLLPLSSKICQTVLTIIESSLLKRFHLLDNLGKIYLDDNLQHFAVPLMQRTASKALVTIPQGSRLPLPDADIIRFFCYWQDGEERTDIDLSTMFLSDDFENLYTIAYYNLREPKMGCYHSGDITSAPDGASEFIDINKQKLINNKVRYVVMVLNSYTQQPYCDLPICFAGIMGRHEPNSGEIYEPSTVEQRFDLTANSAISIPLIIDLQENSWQWVDLNVTHKIYDNFPNNVASNLDVLSLMVFAMQKRQPVSLYQLFWWHTQARGMWVDTVENADTVFTADKELGNRLQNSGKTVVTPFDIDKILANYL